jgi:1,2-diacylglycerol 3-beta-glucosyltransferase
MIFLSILYWLTAVLVLLSLAGSGYVLLLAIVGYGDGTPRVSSDSARTTRFVILIPAHNEEEGIRPTLHSVQAQEYPAELRRVLVVADNCQDRTATVVREQGVECWERHEPDSMGKGRALRWALDRLRGENFDAAVFVDADTRLCAGFLAAMDREIQAGGVALQARNEFELVDSSYFSLLSYASKRAENSLYWRARQRLGLQGFLSGNGFCLKREILESHPWSAFSIVEDIEYSLQLTLEDVRVKFADSAAVQSRPTTQAKEAYGQRLRWASGTMQVIGKYAPKLLLASLKQGSWQLAEAAVALVLTSRLLLVYVLMVAGASAAILAMAGKGLSLGAGVLVSVAMLAIYTQLVLAEMPAAKGERWKAIVKLPFYLGWISLVHIGAAVNSRRVAWGKSSR